jgi:hypothetical protein
MPMEGAQVAEILKTSVYTKDNGTVDVNVRFVFSDRSEMSAHIYITEKRKHMARAELKACGFDPDNQDVWDLDEHPDLLTTNEVPVIVFMDEYEGKRRLKCEIDIPKSKPDPNKMKKATMLLREAKGKDKDAESAENAQKIIEGFPKSPPPPPEETEAPF